MRALIREHKDGTTEVILEPFSPWVIANMAWLTGTETDSEGNPLPGDGWTLVEDWEPEEDVHDEGNTYVVDVPGCENITSGDSKKSLLDELKELL